MRTFIQLRDRIAFAIINTTGELNHSTTPDHTTAVEVFTDTPEQFLKMTYNQETKSWSDTPLIIWAQVNGNGIITEIGRTYFKHEVPTDAIIVPEGVDSSYKWIDNEWVAPVIHVPSTIIEEPSQGMIDSSHAHVEQPEN